MSFHNVPPNGFPDLPDVEELEAVIKDVTNLKTSVAGLSEDVSDLNDNKANQITIAPFFNPETAYEVGDLVYYNGLSYRCTNAHEGEWDADDFAGTTIANELAEVKSGLISVDKIAQYPFNSETMTDFNDLVTDKPMTIYQIGTTANMANKPSQTDGFGVLVVFSVSGYISQVWLASGGGLGVLHRDRIGTTWSSWL